MEALRDDVIDVDAHVAEPASAYIDMIDPAFRDRARAIVDYAARVHGIGAVGGGSLCFNLVAQGYERTGRRPLGARDLGEWVDPSQRMVKGGHHERVRPGAGKDPHATRLDLQEIGIGRAVFMPASATSICAFDDPPLEAALCRAYNRWVGEFCSAYPGAFFAAAVVCADDGALAADEVHRVAAEPWCVGVVDGLARRGMLADHPSYHPFYGALQETGLTLCSHSGTDRPPYAPARAELADNYFLLHLTGHVWQQMRTVAALLGGGILDLFPDLRVVLLESGCGWIVHWMDRLDDHAATFATSVPRLARPPREHLRGDQFFISFEPDEASLPFVCDQLGDDHLVFASDYPHFDAKYPGMVDVLLERPDLSDDRKQRLLTKNAQRLFPRL
jgi:predicted TIM-barrel fold metal-dependent hydrolase